MTKEELLSEMYRLITRFDHDILQLTNMLRENGELNDEIDVSSSNQYDRKSMIEKHPSFKPEIGAIYDAIVTKILPFGCFVEYAPGAEGLVHISNISQERINCVEEVLKVGDAVKVKYLGIGKMGRMDFSIKDAY